MIARVWSAQATLAGAAAYAEYLQSHVIPQLRTIDGYLGAALLQRAAGAQVELQVLTLWQSLEAIRSFAGADSETAVVTAAASLLTEYETQVRHFAVVLADGPR